MRHQSSFPLLQSFSLLLPFSFRIYVRLLQAFFHFLRSSLSHLRSVFVRLLISALHRQSAVSHRQAVPVRRLTVLSFHLTGFSLHLTVPHLLLTVVLTDQSSPDFHPVFSVPHQVDSVHHLTAFPRL